MKNVPTIDKEFKPIYLEFKLFQEKAKLPLTICVERNDGYNYIFDMKITDNFSESYFYAERIVKSLLWIVGGYKVYTNNAQISAQLKADYCDGGARSFDADFMSKVYENKFEVIFTDKIPELRECSLVVGGNSKGCRIGFDAGGSDRKVSAVIDGECVYSEEVVWFPKITADPQYHYDEIKKAMMTAAAKMPRVDAIGISSAGVYVNNKIMVASLFLKVPSELYDSKVKNMYIDIAKEIGAPVVVANDGDVSALAGSIELKENNVLGLAMGTSEAVGYINSNGGLNGWLSELAFVPCDLNQSAMVDEWSGDYGCGVKYFSQDGVIKLAEMVGIDLSKGNSPAEKLKIVQKLNESGDKRAEQIFIDIGIYLGHAIAFYAMFYEIKYLILLGRVTSGKGGDSILEYSKKVLKEEYPHLSGTTVFIPDEQSRRVGQSVAAATL